MPAGDVSGGPVAGDRAVTAGGGPPAGRVCGVWGRAVGPVAAPGVRLARAPAPGGHSASGAYGGRSRLWTDGRAVAVHSRTLLRTG